MQLGKPAFEKSEDAKASGKKQLNAGSDTKESRILNITGPRLAAFGAAAAINQLRHSLKTLKISVQAMEGSWGPVMKGAPTWSDNLSSAEHASKAAIESDDEVFLP